MKIVLIRHGETALQAEHRYQGRTDAPLSAAGREKLRRADFCPDRVYVTPLVRTQQTAAILFPEAEQIVVPDLREMDFGVFEGRSAAEMEQDPAYRAWTDGLCMGRCPGGESKQEFCDRVCRAFGELAGKDAREGRESLVIVAHGGTQMAVLERFGEEKKDYWKWMLPGGHGYVLEAADTGELLLRVKEICSYA